MNLLEILDALYESVMETGRLYAEAHKDESMSDEVRMQALDKVAKCSFLLTMIALAKSAISQPNTSKFEKGGIISHDFGIDKGEYIIKKP